jgi:micrococcal nuclease
MYYNQDILKDMTNVIGTKSEHRRSSALLFVCLLHCLSAAWIPAYAESFKGKVVGVADGDTITVMHRGVGERIRLHGIDAPEKAQDFGNRARQFVGRFVFSKEVNVVSNGTDKYGRTLGTVALVDGTVLNHEIVRNGYAWWYRKYAENDTELARLEAEARRERRGLWAQANPIPPWEFRHWPGVTPVSPLPSGKLPVLGNRKSRIYHLPNCDSYSKISPQNRVRFPDERAAQRAGYRLAGNCS